MDWVTLLAGGLFVVAWLIVVYQSRTENWMVGRTVGWLVFLGGATIGAFYDEVVSGESALLPWIEPIAALIMFLGIGIAVMRTRSRQ
ncbi:uncharacterized protein HHUB_4261 (plasmid) [Halobacterium hubeiense]|uniref:Uncharacterized protein n=1 Tax=Halobacterium hubeiense TaxID=1407499 RepID=A0A0U5H6J4_9EURY|nr:hypothetical protein [Halobacterium hubeiense]CQH64041.1 uncharacterized protein HHUB_4261 [Halobacterium hubeiense]